MGSLSLVGDRLRTTFQNLYRRMKGIGVVVEEYMRGVHDLERKGRDRRLERVQALLKGLSQNQMGLRLEFPSPLVPLDGCSF